MHRFFPFTILGLFSANVAQAEPWEFAGGSLRDVSMAGAGAAGSAPGAALPIDPGAVAGVNGETIAVGWRGSYPSIQIDDEDLMDGPIQALDLAVAFGAPLGEANAGAGFMLYLPLPDAVATVVHMEADERYAPLLEDALDFISVDVAGGLALGPIEVAVGAAVGIDLDADTTVTIRSIDGERTDDDRLDITDNVDVWLDRQLVWSITPLVGAHLRHEQVDAYISYRGHSGFRTRGNTELGADFDSDLFADLVPDMDIPVDYYSVWTPARVAMGVSAPFGRFRPELMAKYLWSSGWRDTQNRAPDPEFVDVPVVGLGLETELGHGLLARTGYAFHPSPVPDQTGQSRLADADRHVVGLGVGWAHGDLPRDNDETEISLGIQGQQLAPRIVGNGELSGWVWTVSTAIVTRL